MFEQQYTMTLLILMMFINIIFMLVVFSGILPVEYATPLAFLCMFLMIGKVKRDLILNVKMWEKAYKQNQD